jgi:N-dimethylarginine dimethylaminohydrolase
MAMSANPLWSAPSGRAHGRTSTRKARAPQKLSCELTHLARVPIEVDPAEPHATNALLIGDTAVYPEAFPRTAARLARAGVALRLVDVSELAKAEGAVTCCSLLVPH